MNRLTWVLLNALLLSGSAFAQSPAPLEPEQIRVHIQGPPVSGPIWLLQEGGVRERAPEGDIFFMTAEIAGDQEIIKNAPFTATVVSESTQTLSDGNRIANKSSGFLARDSQGRTRREQTLGQMGPLQVGAPAIVFISDPVAHTNYVLQPGQRTARVTRRDENAEANTVVLKRKIEALTRERRRAERPMAEEEKVDVKHEDLGMQDIEGVACQGRRETVTIPAGQFGNERPIVTTTEIWTSEDLHVTVLKKHTDPRFGETVYRLTNIKIGEPDASLFQVPSGYKTIKGEGVFSKD